MEAYSVNVKLEKLPKTLVGVIISRIIAEKTQHLSRRVVQVKSRRL